MNHQTETDNMEFIMSEKTKNQAAALTAITLLVVAYIWFPVAGICYLAFLWFVAVTSKDFGVLLWVTSPVFVTYFAFLALIEYKTTVVLVKAAVAEIKRRYKEQEYKLF